MLCPQKQHEEIVPAIVVVIADADARLPSVAAYARFLCHIGEGSVAIVFIETRRGRVAGGPFLVEARSVGQINV